MVPLCSGEDQIGALEAVEVTGAHYEGLGPGNARVLEISRGRALIVGRVELRLARKE